jgi:hypothetical protein
MKKVIGTDILVLLCYPDFNKPVLFVFVLIHQIISWGQSSCRIKSLLTFIRECSLQLKSGIQPLRETESCYQLLKPVRNITYKNILLGYHLLIIVFTDQKNNAFNGLKEYSSDRVLRPCWLLLLEEYGVTFEYLPGKKNAGTVADALSRLDIDSLKIQEEEVLTLLSGSENNSISNIKLTILMDTALIFKEQAKVKRLREKG